MENTVTLNLSRFKELEKKEILLKELELEGILLTALIFTWLIVLIALITRRINFDRCKHDWQYWDGGYIYQRKICKKCGKLSDRMI